MKNPFIMFIKFSSIRKFLNKQFVFPRNTIKYFANGRSLCYIIGCQIGKYNNKNIKWKVYSLLTNTKKISMTSYKGYLAASFFPCLPTTHPAQLFF